MGKSHSHSKKHTPEGVPQHFCLCIDYREVNCITPAVGTKKGTFALMPLPKINEIFALLKGVMSFTSLYL